MKKAVPLCALLIFLLLQPIALVAYAHPGRTDGRGGHTNHSTGEYHYHHGQSAHDHYDMDGDCILDCPYDFNDTTDHSSESSKASSKSIKVKVQKDDNKILIGIFAIGLYFFLMFVLPFLLS